MSKLISSTQGEMDTCALEKPSAEFNSCFFGSGSCYVQCAVQCAVQCVQCALQINEAEFDRRHGVLWGSFPLSHN